MNNSGKPSPELWAPDYQRGDGKNIKVLQEHTLTESELGVMLDDLAHAHPFVHG